MFLIKITFLLAPLYQNRLTLQVITKIVHFYTISFMRQICISTLLTFLFVTLSQAQTVKGKITNSHQQPIEQAVVVLQSPDSTYIDSFYTDDYGSFQFQTELESFRLIVQHLLYETSSKLYNNDSLNPINIQLTTKEHTLSEVVITSDKPLVKLEEGRLTYDIGQISQQKSITSAYDALLQVPGVVEYNDNVTLVGSQALTVVINGKPSSMSAEQVMTLLKSMPKERVQHVEVMYVAPPQYHVNGAVINLVLKEQQLDAPKLQGQVTTDFKQRYYANYQIGTTLLYNTKRTSTDMMYSYGHTNNRLVNDVRSHHLYQGVVHDIYQKDKGNSWTNSHNIRLNHDLKITDKNTLSLTYTSAISPKTKGLINSDGTLSTSTNVKESDRAVQMHNLQAFLNTAIGLTVGADYTFYDNRSGQDYREYMVGKENQFTSNSRQKIHRIAAYADQRIPLKKEWVLMMGTKFSFAKDNSNQIYHSQTDANLANANTDSKVNEYTYTLYGGVHKKLSPKLSFTAILAAQYFKHHDNDYTSIFPRISASYNASPNHVFQLGVSSNKIYPKYWELINSVSYFNGYAELHGNPDLKPYSNVSSQLTYIYKKRYIFTAFLNYMNDYFAQTPHQSTDKLQLIYKTVNFDYYAITGINSIIPFKIGRVLDSRLMLTGMYNKINSDNYYGEPFENSQFSVMATLQNSFNISAHLKADLSASFTPRNIQGPMTITKMHRVDAGVKWIINNNAELKVHCNDIFNGWSPRQLLLNYNQQNLEMHLTPDSRYIGASFVYRFGKFKEQKRKEVDTSRFGQ